MGRKLISRVIFSIASALILNDVNAQAPAPDTAAFRYMNGLQTSINYITQVGKADFAIPGLARVFNAKSEPAVADLSPYNSPNIADNTTNPCLTGGKTKSCLPAGSGLLIKATPLQTPITQLLRLKLMTDTLNYDDIAIGFSGNASNKYDPTEDAKYMPGIDAPEGLSSFSSDGVRLSVNVLPLPHIKPLKIRLDVEGRLSRTYKLDRTELSNVPPIYEFWLIDKYKKDSLDLKNNADYTFDLDLRDTATYGANRFSVLIRQNPALGVHLLNFTAIKAPGGALIGWQTENEQDYTGFSVERSSNNGTTFEALDSFASTASGEYRILDKNPPEAIDQYRLRIEDLNGIVSYSNIITLTYGNPGGPPVNNITIYPNPAGNIIHLVMLSPNASFPGLAMQGKTVKTIGLAANPTANALYSIKIINITGFVVKTATARQDNWQCDVTNLHPGTYIIQVQNDADNSPMGKGTFVKL